MWAAILGSAVRWLTAYRKTPFEARLQYRRPRASGDCTALRAPLAAAIAATFSGAREEAFVVGREALAAIAPIWDEASLLGWSHRSAKHWPLQ
jgi:hypothetical protein